MRRSLSAAGFFPVCTETLKRAQRAASTYPVRQHHMHHSHTEENSRSSFTLQVLQSEKIQLFFDFQGWKFRFCRTKKKTFQDDLGYESELMDGKRPPPTAEVWDFTSGSHCKKKKKQKKTHYMLSDFKPASALWEAFSTLAHKMTSCFGANFCY